MLSLLYFHCCSFIRSMIVFIFLWLNPWVRAYFVSLAMWDFDASWFLSACLVFFTGSCIFVGLIGEWGLNWAMFCVTFRRNGCCWLKEQPCLHSSLLNLTEYCLALLINLILLHISPFTTAFVPAFASCRLIWWLFHFPSFFQVIHHKHLSLSPSIFQGLVFFSCPVQRENRSASCLTALWGASPPAGPLMACDLPCQVNTHTQNIHTKNENTYRICLQTYICTI